MRQRGNARCGDVGPRAIGAAQSGTGRCVGRLLVLRSCGGRGTVPSPFAPPICSRSKFFVDPGLALVCQVTGMRRPFPDRHSAYLLIEAAGQHDPMPAISEALDSTHAIEDVAVATEAPRRAQLWRYREGHTEAINSIGVPHPPDVTLPSQALADFIDQVPGIVNDADPRATTWLFGHAADGNVHVNITGVDSDDLTVDDRVSGLRSRTGWQHQRRAWHRQGEAAVAPSQQEQRRKCSRSPH